MILTIDMGTTFYKFALFDRAGKLLETCRLAPPTTVPEPGRMELPADAFTRSIRRGIAELQNHFDDLNGVEAVSFSTQTNSFLLLDDDNHALTPIILWPDRRAKDDALDVDFIRRVDRPDFSAITGLPSIDFQFMPAKLLWLQKNCPEIWNRKKKICLIGDYLAFLFTGKFVTEAGVSGLTGLLDTHRCRWWPEMLELFGIEQDMLPEVFRAGADLGTITPTAAERFGLPDACRFVVGCLDQYAGAIGAGNIEPGMISETTGTVLATVRFAENYALQLGDSVLQGPAFREGCYWRMAFGGVSANYLQWYREQLAARPEFDRLIALAENIAPGAEGLRLNTSVEMSEIGKIFDGLSPQHGIGHQVRCILEAVAVSLKNQIWEISEGAMPSEVRCAGGAARSDLWLQLKADVLNVPTAATECPEPTSLGAAILAESALTNIDLRQIAHRWIRLKPPHIPDPRQCEEYRNLFG
jgi:xylulokinase